MPAFGVEPGSLHSQLKVYLVSHLRLITTVIILPIILAYRRPWALSIDDVWGRVDHRRRHYPPRRLLLIGRRSVNGPCGIFAWHDSASAFRLFLAPFGHPQRDVARNVMLGDEGGQWHQRRDQRAPA